MVRVAQFVIYRAARTEEVEQLEEPQTVEPPTPLPPCKEKHITFWYFFPPYIPKLRFSYVDTQLSGEPHNATVQQKRPVHPRVHVRNRVRLQKHTLLNLLLRRHLTNFWINQVATDIFDQLADFVAVSTGGAQELQAVLESLVVIDPFYDPSSP